MLATDNSTAIKSDAYRSDFDPKTLSVNTRVFGRELIIREAVSAFLLRRP